MSTLAEILSREEERTELIYGTPHRMSLPTRAHQHVLMELSAQLHAYLKGKKCRVYPAPFAVRPFEQRGDAPREVDTMVEPDISVVCDPDKLDKIGCKGAPDLVIEILSPSTQRHDRVTKFNLYLRAGVKEYWIVDPEGKTVQTFVLQEGSYAAQEFATSQDTLAVSVLEDCTLDLSQVFLD